MINNRQNGRRRGRGGQQARNGQPGAPDRGNRLDNRARGNAAQLLEKYKTLARDAQMQGDRVNTEYYLQFADHYFRVLSETRSRFEEQQRRPRDDFSDDDQQRGYQADDNGDDGWDDNENDRVDGPQEYRQVEARQPEQQRQPEYRQSENRREPRQSEAREPRQSESRQSEPRQSDQREPRQPSEPRQLELRQPESRQDRQTEPRGSDARGEPRQPEPRAEQPQRRPRREDRAVQAEVNGEAPQRAPRRNADSSRGRAAAAASGGPGNGAPANGEAGGFDPASDHAEAEPARIAIDLPPSISGGGEPPVGEVAGEGEAAPKRRRTRRPRAETAPAEV